MNKASVSADEALVRIISQLRQSDSKTSIPDPKLNTSYTGHLLGVEMNDFPFSPELNGQGRINSDH